MRRFSKIYLALAVMLVAFGPSTIAAATPGDALLDKVVAWCKAKNSIEADYTISSDGESLAGNMIVSGNKFRVKSTMIDSWFDGTTQWTYNPSVNEVSVSEPTPDEIQQINPFAIIDAFRHAYNVALGGGDTPNSKFDLLILTPKTNNADIRRVEISVPKQAAYPSRIVIRMASGEVVVLNMKRFIRGTSFTPSTFVYDPALHPKAKTIDLR